MVRVREGEPRWGPLQYIVSIRERESTDGDFYCTVYSTCVREGEGKKDGDFYSTL
jgi:hypothetical protein